MEFHFDSSVYSDQISSEMHSYVIFCDVGLSGKSLYCAFKVQGLKSFYLKMTKIFRTPLGSVNES